VRDKDTLDVAQDLYANLRDWIAAIVRDGQALRTGIAWVNTHGTTVSEMPHGGVRDSGYGSDLSMAGLLDYTQVKHVMM
jgi:betaine-aldehyde dehydrogenase